MTNKFADENVGYCRPPKRHQFKKGQSGNPKGRPKGRKSIMAQLDAALNERIFVQEAGQRKQMTKLAAGTKQFVNKIASGDPQALKILIALKDCPEWTSKPESSKRDDPNGALKLLLMDSDRLHEKLMSMKEGSPSDPCS